MKKPTLTIVLSFILSAFIHAQIKPVTPDALPEAVKLLEYLYSISGKYTLAGQHCVPLEGSLNLPALEKQLGKYPAVFGQDFGFSAPGTWDGINYRQQIVDEAIRRYNEGFIITIMWHAVRPIEDEPVEFRESIQGELTVEEWNDLITPGTLINEHWKSQVDVIAFFLKQLSNAKVPVLWRPYHEMNGDWFWWGQKEGENGYRKLYRMLYDRLVNYHHIKNLIWVFNGNEMREKVKSYKLFYPGDDVVDILATDVYSQQYYQHDYEELLEIAGERPIALGEVGLPPPVELLQKQPRWTWFMKWNGYISWRDNWAEIKKTYESEEVITWDELPWVTIKEPVIHYPVIK
jgi:mannan endo-1,4-beta-mannosidase